MTERRGTGRVRLDLERPWAELVLDHPVRRNAMTLGMVDDLEAAVDALEAAPPAALLLTGAGDRAFCAGSDLRRVRETLDEPAAALDLCRRMTGALRRLEALPMLRAVAIEGAAVGGGAELALVGHRIFLGQSAVFGFLHASLGVSPGWGGGARLAARVGRLRAVRVLAEARRLPAASARELGLVDDVVPDGAAVGAARAWLADRCALGADVLRAAVAVGGGAPAADEAAAFARLWGGPAHRRALGQSG